MKLYLKFLSIHLRSAMTYRSSFLLSCLGHLLITTNVFLSVVFLLDRFDSIGGYTLPQLALCFSVILAATSLAECFARGIDAFGRILSEAQFDRIMLRPRRDLFRALPAPQHRLELTPLQGGVHRLPDAGKVRHQGAGFAVWIVLTKGYKRVIPLKADSSPYPIQPTNL